MGLVGIEKEERPFPGLVALLPDLHLGCPVQHQSQLKGPVDMGIAVDDLDDTGPHMVQLGVGHDLIFFLGDPVSGHVR